MKNLIYLGLAGCCLFLGYRGISQSPPHLEKRGQATQLIVDGKPFLVLGGELHNSSSSNLDYLNPLWEPLKKLHINTALVAVSWQLIEPQEGQFDFSLVDGMFQGARAANMKLIPLWFGSWKNGLSHYVPDWVKKDTKRFPRILLQNGKSTETLSALSNEAMQADARAFAALMRHIKKIDAQEHTALMVQVENEVGVIGGARDYAAMANVAFGKNVPDELLKGFQKNLSELQPALKHLWETNGSKMSGNWSTVFGNGMAADEAFMAWHYAKYLNAVAEAGKKEYNLPMFVNSWIVQPEDKQPGDYPSGGPQAHMHDIWRLAAPSINIKAPDVYLPNFKAISAEYVHSWNPLFVPESFSGLAGAANAFYTIGKYNGIGYSPFGIDGPGNEAAQLPLAKAYKILDDLAPEIVAAQATGMLTAVSLQMPDSVETFRLGGYEVTVTLRKNWSGVTQASKGYGLIMQTAANAFTIAGSNIDLSFVPATPGPKMAGLASIYEGTYVNGTWKPGRLLNGDNIMLSYKLADEAVANRTGTGARLLEEPQILKLKLYRFE